MKLRKYRKVIFVLTIVTTIITIISAGYKWFIRLFLKYRFQLDTNNASSVGIIGGADGPTAIFISSSPYSGVFTIILGALSVVGIIYLIITGKDKHK